MAAGDITRDTGSPVVVGNQWELTGTMEIDGTHRTFAILPSTSNIISFQVQCYDGAGSAEVRPNVNASGTTVLGTVAANGNHVGVETYNYVCRFTM